MTVPTEWLNARRNSDIIAAKQAVRTAQEGYEYAARQARSECDHKEVGEADYANNTWLPSLPPFRVCLHCGFRERGWGCGYHALKDAPDRLVVNVTREQGYALATEPERVSGWWIIPIGRTEPCDPYIGYSDGESA